MKALTVSLMKSAVISGLFIVGTSLVANAQSASISNQSILSLPADGAQGNCQDAAQAAVDAINKINSPQASQMVVFIKGPIGQVEHYQAGGPGPTYTVLTNTGRGEGTCIVESLSYNPQQ